MKRSRKRSRKHSLSIKQEFRRIQEELASLAESLGETASAETKTAINSLRQRLDSLGDVASSIMEEGVEDAREMVVANPLVAVTAAFGLGFLLAALIRR
jgi:ElaB/YqjD/DUF883 family membrane-anchored ribosome-binding protein